MINSFTKDIIRMTQEARDLKTAHLHGLGSTLFYQYQVVIDGLAPNYIGNVMITANVVEGEPFPPLFNISALTTPGANDQGIFSCEVEFSNNQIKCALTVASSSTELTVVLKSSSRLSDISWEES